MALIYATLHSKLCVSTSQGILETRHFEQYSVVMINRIGTYLRIQFVKNEITKICSENVMVLALSNRA